MGAPEPLAAHAVMNTADVDEAQHVVSEVYVRHELDSLGGRPLDARLNSVASERLTLATSSTARTPRSTCRRSRPATT